MINLRLNSYKRINFNIEISILKSNWLRLEIIIHPINKFKKLIRHQRIKETLYQGQAIHQITYKM